MTAQTVTQVAGARGALASVEALALKGDRICTLAQRMGGQSFGNDLDRGFTPAQP